MSRDETFSFYKSLEAQRPFGKPELHDVPYLLKELSGTDKIEMTLTRDGKSRTLDYDPQKLDTALGENWVGFKVKLGTGFDAKDLNCALTFDNHGHDIGVWAEASEEEALDRFVGTLTSRLGLRDPKVTSTDRRVSPNFASVTLTPPKVRQVVETLNRIAHFDLQLMERGKRYWQAEKIDQTVLFERLKDAEEFQKMLVLSGKSADLNFGASWNLEIPLGKIHVDTWQDKEGGNHDAMIQALNPLLAFKNVDSNKDRYRTGTLTFEIQRWSETRFHSAMTLIHRSFAMTSASPEQVKSKVVAPDPLVGTAFVTREARADEKYDGPVEVLESARTMEEFYALIGNRLQTLRAFNLGLEGPLVNTLNLSANLRDKRIEVWSTMELKQLYTIIAPLIDGMELKLVEGRPGVSLKDQPDFLEKATSTLTQLGAWAAGAAAILATLGITFAGDFDGFLVGRPLIEVSHPVKNDLLYEGQETTALSLNWKVQHSLLRRWTNVLPGVEALGDTLDVVVYKNGERLDDLSTRATPGTTLPLGPGKYRIDLDHPARRVRDATIYVNIADPAAPEPTKDQ